MGRSANVDAQAEQADPSGTTHVSADEKGSQHTLMGLYSPFLMVNQGSKGGGGPLSSLGGLGCKDASACW